MGLLKTVLRFFGIDLDSLVEQAQAQQSGRVNPATGQPVGRPLSGTFKAKDPVDILYTNAQGEEKTITADRYTILPKGEFISACVEPTGLRIAFRKSNIQNMDDISGVLEAFELFPKGNDLRTLKYHMKRGTTSEKFEELKEQYSEWVAFESDN